MLTLYFAPGASSMAAHIALHEIGEPFEARPMSFKNNDMRAAEFLKINPAGKVPTLLIDGRALTEGAGIPLFMAGRVSAEPLLPPEGVPTGGPGGGWAVVIPSTLDPGGAPGRGEVAD